MREQSADTDWIDGIASLYKATPQIEWQAIRSQMPAAPVVPPAPTRISPLDACLCSAVAGAPASKYPRMTRRKDIEFAVGE